MYKLQLLGEHYVKVVSVIIFKFDIPLNKYLMINNKNK